MPERKSSLFPNKKSRPRTNGMQDIETFTNSLEARSDLMKREQKLSESPIKKESKPLKNPNKSHKGKAGRKPGYNDPRLKKDQNMKVSMSTKVRIQRLIARKFDNKSEGDVIDIALDYLVSSFDRDDRDSLFKAYQEDMDLMIPMIEKKNEEVLAKGQKVLPITPEINKQTLKEQKEKWVTTKFE